MKQLQKNIYLIKSFQSLRFDAEKRLEEISVKLVDVKYKKRVTENVVEEAQQRNEDVKEQLKSNDNYRQISHLEEKLNDFMEENKSLQETFDQLRKVCYLDNIFSIFLTISALDLLILYTWRCFEISHII